MAIKPKTKFKSYFELLKVDPNLLTTFIARYITNIRVVTLLILTIVLFGSWAFVDLPRRLNPEIQIPIVFVATILPGAGPEDIENLVTIPLENAVSGVAGIKTVTSNSRENVSTIIIEFESGVEPDTAKNDTQTAIDTVRVLPEDALDPTVAALDFEDTPVWTFAVTSDADIASLTRFADVLETRIEALGEVKNVVVTGLEQEEIQVLVRPEIFSEYRISPIALSQSIKSETASYPVGTVRSDGYSYPVSIEPLISTLDDMRALSVTLNGTNYRLSEIADISLRSAPNQTKSFYSTPDGETVRTITFSVFKRQKIDIDDASRIVKAEAERVALSFQNRFEIISIMDLGEEIATQFSDLIRNLLFTVSLVFLTLFLFLGIKQAIVASFVMPLAFLVTFAVMQLTGITINFLSMFSLVLALGMLVDTAVVVISAMTSYYQTGKFTPQETGVLVFRDFSAPLLTSTLTTVWAFLPLLLATGIIGDFIKTIPIVVITALLASTALSFLVTLPLMTTVLEFRMPRRIRNFFIGLFGGGLVLAVAIFLGDSVFMIPAIMMVIFALFVIVDTREDLSQQSAQYLKKQGLYRNLTRTIRRIFLEGSINSEVFSHKYESILRRILISTSLRKKVVGIVLTVFIFSILLFPLGYIKNIFFPKTDAEVIYVSIDLPAGATYENTTTVAQSLLPELLSLPEVKFITTEIGRAPMIQSTQTETESNKATFSLLLNDDRSRASYDIAQSLRDQFERYPQADITVLERSAGPPVGADIAITLSGEDLSVLKTYADSVIQYLNAQDGVANAEKSVKPGTSRLTFVPNRLELSESGITIDQLGLWLRTYVSGFTLDEAEITTDENQEIVFRFFSETMTPQEFSRLSIPSSRGQSIPLLSLGMFKLETNPTVITRENDERTISITGTVEPGYNPVEIGSKLEIFADGELDLSPGYTWSTGGANEENAASVRSILLGMLLAFILILATMVIQFRSYRKALIVMMIIPLALSGVFIIFSLTGTPLSFPALIGLLALFGIVVNNSIMIVEKVNQNLERRMEFTDALSEGTASRVEPILFTTLTTIIGLVPITLSDPFWQGLGGAIIAGLTFSGTIALFFIPVMYYMMFAREYIKK